MVAIAERRVLRLVVLCALYVAQGLPFGFVTVTLAAYLAGAGATTDEVGSLIAWTTVPWAFKWVWGPVVDRFARSTMGRRRPWILGAQSMMIITAGAMIALPGLRENFDQLLWLVLAHNVFASLQDVSVDALAVDLLPEGDRGGANGLMYGCSYLGVAIGGAGLSTVVGHFGLHSAMVVQVLCLTGIMLLPLLLREHAGDKLLSLRSRKAVSHGAGSMWEVMKNLRKAFSRRSPILGAALALSSQVGLGVVTAVSTVLLMQKLGWKQEEYGQMIGGLPLLFGLVGSVGGGFTADHIGHRRIIAASCILIGATWIGFALGEPLWPQRNFIIVITCAQEFFFGILSATLFALFMSVSWPRVAATQFTAYMAMLNLSRTFGSRIAGTLSAWLGVAGCYFGVGLLQIGVIVFLFWLDPLQNRRELGETTD
jgi:PAT family beta-lactamase induction signal transducer AmpG